MPLWLSLIALLLVAGSWFMVFWVFRVNNFAGRTIEVEAGQAVISSGPYALVGHAMYAHSRRGSPQGKILRGHRGCARLALPPGRLLLAPGHGFSASSVNYGGRLPEDAETLLVGACPIVASYGAKDRWNRGVADRLERVLTAVSVAHDVKEYPDAGHSFLNNHHDVFFEMMKVFGIAYQEPSAQDAHCRIVAFFDAHLKSPPAAL